MSKNLNNIRITKGPQFNLKGGHILAVLFVTFLVLTISSLITAHLIFTIVLLLISIILLNIVLDIQGIELDTKNKLIRNYRQILWIKFGKWSNLDDYRNVWLSQKNVVIPTSEYSDHIADTYHYYHVKLVDETHDREILLYEYRNYYKARTAALNIAGNMKLELKDFLKDHL
ncbi:MAG: hypothetical protein JXB00_03575 [Bacteroidales bacterium]|nr:hypothetical protein [Bacteroidales bacterium]